MIYLAILGTTLSVLLATGWIFANIQGEFPNLGYKYRESLGWAIMLGLLFGVIPGAFLLVWLMTGFAEHGWRLWPTDAERASRRPAGRRGEEEP